MQTERNPIQSKARRLVEALCEADQRREVAASFPKPVGYEGTVVIWEGGRSQLVVSTFVAGTWWKEATEQQKLNFRKTAMELNDPDLAGRYERAGGSFVFREDKGFYLVRSFQIPETSEEVFVREVTKLRKVALRWTTEWFADVAQETHRRAADKKSSPSG